VSIFPTSVLKSSIGKKQSLLFYSMNSRVKFELTPKYCDVNYDKIDSFISSIPPWMKVYLSFNHDMFDTCVDSPALRKLFVKSLGLRIVHLDMTVGRLSLSKYSNKQEMKKKILNLKGLEHFSFQDSKSWTKDPVVFKFHNFGIENDPEYSKADEESSQPLHTHREDFKEFLEKLFKKGEFDYKPTFYDTITID
jgi:hypothetical protein